MESTMKKLLGQALILAISLAPAVPAFAQGTATFSAPLKAADAKSCTAGSCERQRSFVKLSDDQLEKLNSLKMKFKQDSSAKRAELALLRGQLRDSLSKANVDKSEVLSMQSKINGLQADLDNARLSMMIDARSVFTPEQRQEFRRKHLERGMLGGSHRGAHGKHFRGGHDRMRTPQHEKA